MKRIALILAALVMMGGFAVAVPLVAGGAASAGEYTGECVDNSLMTSDHNHVVRDQARVKAQQQKVKKIAHQKPKTEKAEKAKLRHLKGAKRKLQRDKNQLRHDQQVYSRDVPCDPSDSASPSAGASGSTTASPSAPASSPTSGSSNPLCPVLGVVGLC